MYSELVVKQQGKRPLGRPSRRWFDSIRIDLWNEGVVYDLVGETEGKRPLGRPRRRWFDNIVMDLLEECGVWGLRGETGRIETTRET